MQTRIITTEQEIIALKDDWDRLVRSNPETDMPFYSWDWFYCSWIHFGKLEGQELFIVAVYENDHAIGILPLVRRKRKSSGIVYRILCFCNVGMMTRNTMYVDYNHNQESVFHVAWWGGLLLLDRKVSGISYEPQKTFYRRRNIMSQTISDMEQADITPEKVDALLKHLNEWQNYTHRLYWNTKESSNLMPLYWQAYIPHRVLEGEIPPDQEGFNNHETAFNQNF